MLYLSRESATRAPGEFYHQGHLFKCQQIAEDWLFSPPVEREFGGTGGRPDLQPGRERW